MARTGRLLELAHLLRGRKAWTAREIAERLGISLRTAYRDLAELEAGKIPLEECDGGWRLDQSAELPPVSLTVSERSPLRLALANPAFRRQRSLRRALDSIRSKLAVALGPGTTRGKEVEPVLELATLDRTGPVPEPIFEALRRAVAEHRSCEVVYDSLSGGERRQRRLDPYRIFLRGQAWYLAAFCAEHRDVRLFRLDRFDSVTPLELCFAPAPGFELDSFLAASWDIYRGDELHEVLAVFDPSLRALIGRGHHHPSEQVTIRPDGSLLYRAKVSSLEEISRWFVTFGEKVEILQPLELVLAVCSLAIGVLGAHDMLPVLAEEADEAEEAEPSEELRPPEELLTKDQIAFGIAMGARNQAECRELTREALKILSKEGK